MPFDDESLLSAYLDGELDPARRQLVESALQSSPALASRLRDLAGVRDVVHSLGSPPAPKDLAPGILQHLRDTRDRDRLKAEAFRKRLRVGLALAPVLGIAAALLITWSMRGLGVGPEPPEVNPAGNHGNRGPGSQVAGTHGTPGVTAHDDSADVVPEPSASEPAPQLLAEIDAESEKARLDEQEVLRKILSQPEAHTILVPVDVVNAESQKRVEDAIGLTARAHPRHARMRLYQGVTIDPRHPERAVVYALVLDSTEAGNLRKNLMKTLPEIPVSETGVEPATLARLSETVHLDVFETTPAGSILATGPPSGHHRHAKLSDPRESRSVVEIAPDGYPSGGFPPSGPHRPRVQGPESGPMVVSDDPEDSEEGHQDAVYLVWLYEKARRDDTR